MINEDVFGTKTRFWTITAVFFVSFPLLDNLTEKNQDTISIIAKIREILFRCSDVNADMCKYS